jgi:hypothetical protein
MYEQENATPRLCNQSSRSLRYEMCSLIAEIYSYPQWLEQNIKTVEVNYETVYVMNNVEQWF